MRPGTGGVLLTVVVLGLAACGGSGDEEEATPATTEAAEAGPVTVDLAEVNDSGISGTAALTPTGPDSFRVDLEIGSSEGSHPAHIHEGTCAEYAKVTDVDAQVETVVDTLQDVRDGKSTSNIGLTPLSDRRTGGYSINVHEPAHPFPAVACGDIPSAS